MESTTDVHELLSQYAEEIRSSVGPHNQSPVPPFVNELTFCDRQKVHFYSPLSGQNYPKD